MGTSEFAIGFRQAYPPTAVFRRYPVNPQPTTEFAAGEIAGGLAGVATGAAAAAPSVLLSRKVHLAPGTGKSVVHLLAGTLAAAGVVTGALALSSTVGGVMDLVKSSS